jgi:hypothetical protein
MIEVLHHSWELMHMVVLQRRGVVGTAPVRSRKTVGAVVNFGKIARMGTAPTRPDGHGVKDAGGGRFHESGQQVPRLRAGRMWCNEMYLPVTCLELGVFSSGQRQEWPLGVDDESSPHGSITMCSHSL